MTKPIILIGIPRFLNIFNMQFKVYFFYKTYLCWNLSAADYLLVSRKSLKKIKSDNQVEKSVFTVQTIISSYVVRSDVGLSSLTPPLHLGPLFWEFAICFKALLLSNVYTGQPSKNVRPWPISLMHLILWMFLNKNFIYLYRSLANIMPTSFLK